MSSLHLSNDLDTGHGEQPGFPASLARFETMDPVTSVHRWPWTGQEIGSIFASPLLGIVLGALLQGWWWTSVPVMGLVAYYLYRVGSKRKAVSGVVITVGRGKVKVQSKGKLGDSMVKISEISHIGYREWGSDETFILASANVGSARIPVRATSDPLIAELVLAVAEHADMDRDARDLLGRIEAPRQG